jgi:hypothetical protein
MPVKSLTLMLDGEQTPTAGNKVFQTMQRDAAGQLAIDEVILTFFARRFQLCYHVERFP